MRNAMTVMVSGVVALLMTAGSAAAKVPSFRVLSHPVLAAGSADDKKSSSKKNEQKEEGNKGDKADSKNSKQGEDNKKGKGTDGKNKKGDDGDEEKSEKLPKAVAEAVKSIFPGAKIVGTEKEDDDGDGTYEVTLRYKSGKLEATLSPKGRVVKVKMKAQDDDDDEKGERSKNEKGSSEKGKNKKGDDRAQDGKKGTKKSERE